MWIVPREPAVQDTPGRDSGGAHRWHSTAALTVLDHARFGHLNPELGRVDPPGPDGVGDRVHDGWVVQLAGRDVDGPRQWYRSGGAELVELRQLLNCVSHHPLADGDDQSCLLCQRYQIDGVDQPTRCMLPAHKGFEAGKRPLASSTTGWYCRRSSSLSRAQRSVELMALGDPGAQSRGRTG